MSSVLFLSVPSHGHVNPTIGLVSELVARGEQVTYFSSLAFKDKIERTGASFRCYVEDLDMFKALPQGSSPQPVSPIARIIRAASAVIGDILEQTRGQTFDYLAHSAPFPFAKPMAQLLKVPTVSSLAVFAGLDAFVGKPGATAAGKFFSKHPHVSEALGEAGKELSRLYGVGLPEDVAGLLFNKGDLNLVYTSQYFAADINYFDATYKFVGPPVYDRKEQVEFPFERLRGRQVLYISLGTVFGGYSPRLYEVFFESFAQWDGVVVMAAYGVDLAGFAIPDNFIVRSYVPQGELLEYASVAITHCGMNSMSDLLSHEIPFVALPLGADQPLLAARAQSLGATITLDAGAVQPEELRRAVATVVSDGSYLDNIKTIAASFRSAGGYPKAVDEIFAMKRERNMA